MRKSDLEARRQAIQSGLEFVYRSACEPESFEVYGFDFLFCFNWLCSTSQDDCLRATAYQMGQERARFWRGANSKLPSDLDADTLTQFVFACDAAERFGLPNRILRSQIKLAAGRFSAPDFFWFDPVGEPPPFDVPDACECQAENARGRSTCRKCKKPLTMMSHYEVWLVALIRSYIGERFGVMLGAKYADVLKWLPGMRPYCGPENGYYPDFVWALYAITHVVYTLNDYGYYKLSPRWLPQEFAFLKQHVNEAIDMDDPETVGELLDSLKSFGLTSSHSLIRTGEEFILAAQNSDGSWGDVDDDDIYGRYHPTFTAVDGLREHAWRGQRLSFPRLKPLLERWAGTKLFEVGPGSPLLSAKIANRVGLDHIREISPRAGKPPVSKNENH